VTVVRLLNDRAIFFGYHLFCSVTMWESAPEMINPIYLLTITIQSAAILNVHIIHRMSFIRSGRRADILIPDPSRNPSATHDISI
jgi:hypothetical protein